MKKNSFKQLNENCGIAYIQEWGKENDEYWYVVYVKGSRWDESAGEVWGKGKTLEEAMEEAIKNLVNNGLKSFPLCYCKDISLQEFIKFCRDKEGFLSDLPYEVMPIKDRGQTSVIIHEGEAYPFSQ